MSTSYFDGLLAQHNTAHKIYVLAVSVNNHVTAYEAYLKMKEIEGHWHNLTDFANDAKNYQNRQLIENCK